MDPTWADDVTVIANNRLEHCIFIELSFERSRF